MWDLAQGRSRKHDGVNPFDQIGEIEQIGLTRARRASANIHSRDRAVLGKDDRAPRRPFRQGVVADFHTCDGGEG